MTEGLQTDAAQSVGELKRPDRFSRRLGVTELGVEGVVGGELIDGVLAPVKREDLLSALDEDSPLAGQIAGALALQTETLLEGYLKDKLLAEIAAGGGGDHLALRLRLQLTCQTDYQMDEDEKSEWIKAREIVVTTDQLREML